VQHGFTLFRTSQSNRPRNVRLTDASIHNFRPCSRPNVSTGECGDHPQKFSVVLTFVHLCSLSSFVPRTWQTEVQFSCRTYINTSKST